MISNISSFKPVSLAEFTSENSTAIYKAANTEKAAEFSLNLDIPKTEPSEIANNINDTFVQTAPPSAEIGSFFDGYA